MIGGIGRIGRASQPIRPSVSFADYGLFGPADDGFLFNFSKTDRLFQDVAGTIPVAVDADPIALALDGHSWGGKTLAQVIAGQADQRGAFVAGLTGSATTASYNASTGAGSVTRVDLSNQSWCALNPASPGLYAFNITNTGAVTFWIRVGGATGTIVQILNPGTSFAGYINNTGTAITITASGGTATFTLNSCKAVPGNHSLQATTSARPFWKNPNFSRLDGSDDNWLTTFIAPPSFSLAARIKISTGGKAILGSRTTNATDNCYIFITVGGQIIGAAGNSDVTGTTNVFGTTGVVVLTFDAASKAIKTYWQGSSEATGAATGGISASKSINVGSMNTAGAPQFFAAMDLYNALAINRAITPGEALNLSNYWNAQ